MIKILIFVEGLTERKFAENLLQEYLNPNKFHISVTYLNKKGGDIEFEKAYKNIHKSIKDGDRYVSTMFDFYGIDSKWPGNEDAKKFIKTGKKVTSLKIAETLNDRTKEEVEKRLGDRGIDICRFKPYFQIHEFEALVFCDQNILASEIGCKPKDPVFKGIKFNNPELINGKRDTSPSHRLENIFDKKKKLYTKTYTGIKLAQQIGIDAMRKKCPNFDSWLKELESLKPLS